MATKAFSVLIAVWLYLRIWKILWYEKNLLHILKLTPTLFYDTKFSSQFHSGAKCLISLCETQKDTFLMSGDWTTVHCNPNPIKNKNPPRKTVLKPTDIAFFKNSRVLLSCYKLLRSNQNISDYFLLLESEKTNWKDLNFSSERCWFSALLPLTYWGRAGYSELVPEFADCFFPLLKVKKCKVAQTESEAYQYVWCIYLIWSCNAFLQM